ncbi:MAG: polysaccharide deacetylase family protein [Endomicrobiaceae bacterium]|nr:polysaccharide deacetylase family protein [Endomicrobiaceae bacterium]
MKKILYFLILFFLIFTETSSFSDVFYANGDGKKKQIALTFDDGPGKNTKEILDILKEKNIKATFFISGSSVHGKKATVKAIYDSGNEIANHTYSHVNFFKYKKPDIEDKIKSEIFKCETIIHAITNYKTKLLRIPHGFSRAPSQKVAKELGYIIVNWSFGCDWNTKLTQEQMYQLYKKNIKSGAIFLMHDSKKSKKVVNFLPQLIDDIKQEGYDIVTVSELLNLNL